MWVDVAMIEDGRYTGMLLNDAVLMPLEYGELVRFTSLNIINIVPHEGDAMVAEFGQDEDATPDDGEGETTARPSRW